MYVLLLTDCRTNIENIYEHYPTEVHKTDICDGIGDQYSLRVRQQNAGASDYIFLIRQQGTGPSLGVQEVRMSLDEWKGLEWCITHLNSALKRVIEKSTYRLMEYHIAGPLHANVFYAGDRGPSVMLYTAVFNHTTSAIEQDIFGAVSLDVDAFTRLTIQLKVIAEKFPVVQKAAVCLLTHQGQRQAILCPVCNPWGIRFI